mgnify:CR=1 FL=1
MNGGRIMKKSEKIFAAICIIGLLMVNPPILNVVNSYAKANPLTAGWPTLWIWLEFWYTAVIASFLIAVVKIKNWQKEPNFKEVKDK